VIAGLGKTDLRAKDGVRVKADVRLDRGEAAESLVASDVRAVVLRVKAGGRKVVVKGVRKPDRVKVARVAIAVRGRAADVSIFRRISISKS
jgi:hypothetical protein